MGGQQDDFMGENLLDKCQAFGGRRHKTRLSWKYLQRHKKIPEKSKLSLFLGFSGAFGFGFLFCFDHNDYFLHGLTCISNNNVCSYMFCGHAEAC